MDKLHTPELFIDKDGLWYSDSVLMNKKELIKYFASHLIKDEHNKYYINLPNQKIYPVRVEDTPFYVQSITEQDGQLMIQLYDGRKFPLPAGNIITKNNIPYISLLWECDTKLSRPSYSELCKNMIERDGHYLIKYGDKEWFVKER
ncbi:MAG: DUF1285 domain-containing protein [Desulfosporosinus sp.]|jgi:hypothetical protein